jgi:RNA recognition motif-containing protein
VDHLERNVTEAVILEVFKQYGQVQEVSLFRDAETCSSTGAGYVTFSTTDDALSAMEGLDGKTRLAEDGQTLVVEWALGSSGTLCTREQEQQRERRARTVGVCVERKSPGSVSRS